MDLDDVIDAIAAGATSSAASISAAFKDVAVGYPNPRGRCVRIFYGGEAPPAYFGEGMTLSTRMIGQRIIARGFWPVAEYAAKRSRALMLEMWQFVHNFRTAMLADTRLSAKAVDLDMHLAEVDQDVVAGVLYATVDIEFIVDFNEYTVA